MPAYLKLGDIEGESRAAGPDGFLKLGSQQAKGDVPPTETLTMNYTKVEWTYSSRSKLHRLGMSAEGVEALIAGQPVSNKNDQDIVAGLVQKALG